MARQNVSGMESGYILRHGGGERVGGCSEHGPEDIGGSRGRNVEIDGGRSAYSRSIGGWMKATPELVSNERESGVERRATVGGTARAWRDGRWR